MGIKLRYMLLLLFAVSVWTLEAMAQPETAVQNGADGTGFVVVCPVEEMVDDGLVVIVQRAINEAEGAAALIFVVDTPGGKVDSAIEISNAILTAPCPTIAYVTGMGAISAGALISYSCDHIIMSSATNIGASTPIVMGGAQPSAEFNEKTNSFLRSRYRALGEENGHDPSLGEAMVDADIELRGYLQADGKYFIYRVREEDEGLSKSERATRDMVKAVRDAFESEINKSVEDLLKEKADQVVREALKKKPAQLVPPELESTMEEGPTVLEDGSELVSARGELLTLTSSEALRYGLIPVKADTVDEVMQYYGYGGLRKVMIIPTWAEHLFRFLTSPMISGLLLLLGIGGLYIEIRTPGFGIPGMLGAMCLALFFGSYLVIGLADWLDIFLVLIGMLLILLEIFVIPGFGLAGVSGMICLVVGFYLSLTRVTIPQYSWDFQRLQDAGQTVFFATLMFMGFAILSWRIFPRTPLARRLVLSDAQDASQGYVVQSSSMASTAIGLEGIATSMLRPAGRGRFGTTTYDVVTRGEFIEKGRPIRIIEAGGNRYVVEERHEDDA